MISIPIIDSKKTETHTIVATNIDFSRPRLVVYNSLELPEPEPSEAPLCWSKIKRIVRTAEIKMVTSRKLPNCIITP